MGHMATRRSSLFLICLQFFWGFPSSVKLPWVKLALLTQSDKTWVEKASTARASRDLKVIIVLLLVKTNYESLEFCWNLCSALDDFKISSLSLSLSVEQSIFVFFEVGKIYQATIVRYCQLVFGIHALRTFWAAVEDFWAAVEDNLSHQLRTIILKIDKMFFVRVHATRAYDDVANNKNNETISNLKLIQYNLKNKQATPPPSCQETTRATMVVVCFFLNIC